jgi:pyruvate,water dikinase
MAHTEHDTLFTRNLADVNRHSLTLVGGKGANLGELLAAGFPVPPGFCVTTAAFEHFIAAQRDMGHLYMALDALTPHDGAQVRAAGEEVRAHLRQAPMPAAVEQAVLAAWQALGSEHAYGVRSSATAEDLPDASFAGQQDTYLNVRGAAAVLDAVRNCWISLFTDRALVYRLQHGFAHRDVRLAVVVQRMVVPDIAGIMFTADPVTNNRRIVAIDASYGLGEALVSGVVSADLYHVHTRERRVVKRQIADKQRMIRALPGGGIEHVALQGKARTQPALRDAEVLALARIGEQIAAHYGTPQDIEWALVQGEWFMLQARPITSLYPLPQPTPTDDALHVYFSFSHFQVMTDPMPPLVTSLWRVVFPFGTPCGALENPYITTAGGRLYVDVSEVVRHPLPRWVVPRLLRNADMLAAQGLEEVVARETFAHGPVIRFGAAARIIALLLARVLAQVLWQRPDGAAERGLHLMDQDVARVDAQLRAASTAGARLRVTVGILRDLFPHIIKVWFAVPLAGIVASTMLERVARRFAPADDVVALARGMRGNVTTEMNLAVGDLADLAQQSPQLLAHLSQTGVAAGTLVQTATTHGGGAAFVAVWQQFIDRYGARAPAEIDLRRPRWAEDPASLLQMVLSAATHSHGRTHRAQYERLVAASDAAARRVVQAAWRGPWGWLRGPLVQRFVRLARQLGPTREHHKFWMVRVLALVKGVFVEAGQHLAAQGRIACADDVWFLSIPELLAAMEHRNEPVAARIAERRAAWTRAWQLTPPRVITSEGEIPQVSYAAGAPSGALAGSPVSAGVAEGRARVIRDPQTERLQPGEILVAPFTDPGWTPLFVSAAGLVMEVGGLMTHGSVVAREYGIPAVVGVLDATTRIHTGQWVRVHGTAGYVELLDGEPTKVGETAQEVMKQ